MKLILLFVLLISFSFISPTEQSEELIVYDFYNNAYTGIIILTDSYAYNEHPDSCVIAKKYLIDGSIQNYNYHELDSIHRKRFLESINIKETDTIYIYDLVQNSIFTLNVKDISLVAYIHPYEDSETLNQGDFMVVFEIENTKLNLLSIGADFFVCVAERNPFREGEARRMIWTEIDATLFPNFSTNDKELEKHISSSKTKIHTYHYAVNELDYFVKDGEDFRIVLVTDSEGIVISTEIFSTGDEGTDLNVLFTKEIADKKEYYINQWTGNQWTGNIFKNKPPILFGFESLSSGCPSISFVDKNTSNISISCDNRH